jgi:hypothetical protein
VPNAGLKITAKTIWHGIYTVLCTVYFKIMKKIIKHVDGKTNVIANGYVRDNQFIGEYKYEGMIYGVTIDLKQRYICGYCGNEVDENYNPIKSNDFPLNFEKVEGTCCVMRERLGSF